MQGNASYQNATYMNAFKCISMQYHAAREECNRMECNENVENASECSKMHKNAYGKKPHHFREKTPRIPYHYKLITNVRCVESFAYTLFSVTQLWAELRVDSLFADTRCCRLVDGTEWPYLRDKLLPTLPLVSVAGCDAHTISRAVTKPLIATKPLVALSNDLGGVMLTPPGISSRQLGHHSVQSTAHIARLPSAQAGELMHRRNHAGIRYVQAIANTTEDGPRNLASATAISCASCAEARIKQAAHPGTLSTPAPEAGVLHVDLKEMVISAEGYRYFMVAVDEFTRYLFIAFLKYKSEAGGQLLAIVNKFNATVGTPVDSDGRALPRPRVRTIHSDREGKLISHSFVLPRRAECRRPPSHPEPSERP